MSLKDSKKPVLAVDVDEVLAYFIPALVEFHNEKYDSVFTPDSFFSYEFHEVWGGEPSETNTKLDVFFDSKFFNEDLKPIPGAYDALVKLKDHFDLHVVTSRQNKVKDITLQWIDRHFPQVFTDIHFGNHYSSVGKSRTKSEICHSIGACLLIDDSTKYAIQCVHDNIPVILFGTYAWNQLEKVKVPDNIKFITYESGILVDSSNGILNRISSDVNTSVIDKFRVSVDASSTYNVYRVFSWDDLLSLVYSYFNLTNEIK